MEKRLGFGMPGNILGEASPNLTGRPYLHNEEKSKLDLCSSVL